VLAIISEKDKSAVHDRRVHFRYDYSTCDCSLRLSLFSLRLLLLQLRCSYDCFLDRASTRIFGRQYATLPRIRSCFVLLTNSATSRSSSTQTIPLFRERSRSPLRGMQSPILQSGTVLVSLQRQMCKMHAKMRLLSDRLQRFSNKAESRTKPGISILFFESIVLIYPMQSGRDWRTEEELYFSRFQEDSSQDSRLKRYLRKYSLKTGR